MKEKEYLTREGYENIANGAERNYIKLLSSMTEMLDLMKSGGRIQPEDNVVVRILPVGESYEYEVWQKRMV